MIPSPGGGRVQLASGVMGPLLGLGTAGDFGFQSPEMVQCRRSNFPRRNQDNINHKKGSWTPPYT